MITSEFLMMLFYIALYILGIIGFCVYDALIGFKIINSDEEVFKDGEEILVGAIFWPLIFIILIFLNLGGLLEIFKNKRIEKQKLRVQVNSENEEAFQELEEELKNEQRKL